VKTLEPLLFALVLTLAPTVHAQEAPDALVKRVAQEALDLIKSDPKLQAGDPARVSEVIESRLLPHFDFARMTQLAMGRNWRLASPEQQRRLTEEFRMLLVRTYANTLAQYRDESIQMKPFRAESGATDVVVRTEVLRQGRASVQIDYGMTRTPAGCWSPTTATNSTSRSARAGWTGW
jgi:phospholipid transport system substrate-binding protein